MPGPSERVVVDTGLLAVLLGRLRELRDLLGRWALLVARQLGSFGRPTDPARALRRGAAWADESVVMLTRRLALVESVESARGEPMPDRATLTLRPDPFDGDSAAARAAGRRLGDELVAAGLAAAPDVTRLRDLAIRLTAGATDPDLVAGLLDAVGPARLAALLHLAEKVRGGGFQIDLTSAGLTPHPRAAGQRIPLDYPERLLPGSVGAQLTAALGAVLATFSRSGRLTAGWLARFNARGLRGAAETTLLGPLLGHGRFDPAVLRLLGDTLFAGLDVGGDRYRARAAVLRGGGAVRDVGLFGERSGARDAYAVALLRAIAAEPALAARFATDHVEAMLAGSRLAALPAVLRTGVPAALPAAWAELVASAGGARARAADPAAAATFVARLAFTVHRYDAAHERPDLGEDTAWPLPAGMLAAFASVLRTWRAEMYAAATDLLPEAGALLDATGTGLVASWPVAGPWATHLPGPVDAARIPAPLWAALLGDALTAGGPAAAGLADDAVAVGAGWERVTWAATRGYRGDGRVAYPASPRALGRLRRAASLSFFLTAVGDAADRLALRARLLAADEARQRELLIDQLAALARGVKPGDLWGTAYAMLVGVAVADLTSDARAAIPDGPSAAALATITAVRAVATVPPGWQEAYRVAATEVWLRRADDPILPVEVTDAAARRRRFTGDPRADGFITGQADDFLGPGDAPLPAERMTPVQRDAYLRWLASPAIVANDEELPAAPAGG